MKIEQLKPSARVQGRWLAVLDDGSILRVGESQVIDFALYAGMELTEAMCERLMASAKSSELKEKTIRYLAGKPQSRFEMERKLKSWDASEEETAQLCDRMEELGYLNDESYAVRVVCHFSAKGYGEKKIRDELFHRGIPRDFWDDALAQLGDCADAVDEFLRKKLGGAQPNQKELQRVSNALARRGFSWSEIREGLSRYGAETWEE